MKRNKRGKTEKVTPSSADGETKARQLPLSGKVIYLDIKDSRQTRTLEHKVKKLGAVVEKFLSKEVNYVISHSAPPRMHAQARGHPEGQGPDSPAFVNTPSPFNAVSSPSASATGPDGKNAKIVPMPRGKTMAQIACAVRSPSPNTVVANAEKLGIKVVSVEAALKWLDKELAKLGHEQGQDDRMSSQGSSTKKKISGSGYVKCRRLHQPFIKVESATQHYRPVYRELPSWPHPNVDTPALTCPFDGRGVGEARQSQRGDRDGQASIGNWATPRSQSGTQRRSRSGEDSSRLVGFPILTAGDLRRQREKRKQAQRRRGYCECCCTKYDDIDEHVKEKSHRDFVRDKQNYEALDKLISDGPSTVAFLQSILMQHCKQQRLNKSVCSDQEEEASSDQVLTLNPCTPVKGPPQTAGQGVTSTDVGTEYPGTPTHRPDSSVKAGHGGASPQMQPRQPEKSPVSVGKGTWGDQTAAQLPADDDADVGTKASNPGLPQAVVIRRPGAKNVYPSPRRPKNRSDVARMRERSMVFGHSPIGSLQALIAGEQSASSSTEAGCAKVETSSVTVETRVQDKGKGRSKQRGPGDADSNEKSDIAQGGSRRAESRDGGEKLITNSGVDENAVPRVVRGRVTRSKTETAVLESPLLGSAEEMSEDKDGGEQAQVNQNKGSSEHVANSVPSDDINPIQPCLAGEATPVAIDSAKDNQELTTPHAQDSNAREAVLNPGPSSEDIKPCSEVKSAKVCGEKKKRSLQLQKVKAEHSHSGPLETSGQDTEGVAGSQASLSKETPQQKSKQKTTPRKRRRSASPKFQSVTPETLRTSNQTSVEKNLPESIVTEEEDCSSSPVFPRSVIHCSTPVIVTTRKLRHLSSSQTVFHQDTEVACELLAKPVKSKTRRSIFQDSQTDLSCQTDTGAETSEKRHKQDKDSLEKTEVRKECRSKSRKWCKKNISLEFEAENLRKPVEQDLTAVPQGCQKASDVSPCGEANVSQLEDFLPDDGVDTALDSAAAENFQYPSHVAFEKKMRAVPISTKKKIKLNGSWLLLSDHSMSRLLDSEPDHSPFKGFTGHDEGLPSDLTYEEASEVVVSDTEEHEWVFDNAASSDLDIQTLHSFIPTFSSPGKSDSSWGDTCDLYLSLSIQKQMQPRRSPRRANTFTQAVRKRKRSRTRGGGEASSLDRQPSKKRKQEKRKKSGDADGRCSDSLEGSTNSGLRTPTKQHRQNSGISEKQEGSEYVSGMDGVMCKVDDEVMFNYKSPQKSNTAFSPLRVMHGNVVGACATTPEKVTEKRCSSMRDPLKLD